MTAPHRPTGTAHREHEAPAGAPPAARRPELRDVDLGAWASQAAAGDVIEYHRGHLAEDRDSTTSRLPPRSSARLDRIADVALAMAATGQVTLVQRRLPDGRFSYLAIKAGVRRPQSPPATARRRSLLDFRRAGVVSA